MGTNALRGRKIQTKFGVALQSTTLEADPDRLECEDFHVPTYIWWKVLSECSKLAEGIFLSVKNQNHFKIGN